MGALEQQEVDDALRRLPGVEARVATIERRITRFTRLPAGARVLDIGAALGLYLVAWRRAGYEPVGVEPWAGAVEASSEVETLTGASFEIHEGSGESLPLADESVDLVVAISVMEHVEEPARVFAETHRVLRPGGAFYFYTTSAICPRQAEIRLFPAFPWYPPGLQQRIMRWASQRHPWLVHGTTAPAYHWFRPGPTAALLRRTGFDRVIDRWEMRLPGEDSGIRGRLARAAKTNVAARLALNIAIEDSAYLALKAGPRGA